MHLLILLHIVRILAIGNSFSIDALEQDFVPACHAVGVSPVVANLYIPSCSLRMHAENMTSDSAVYSLRTWGMPDARWDTTCSSLRDALRAVDWDFISLQQASHESGCADSYEPYLSLLLDSVRALCPHARLLWHMTWAYPSSSRYRYFERWGYDQERMYDSIVACTHRLTVMHPEFVAVIPSGTVIQQARRRSHRAGLYDSSSPNGMPDTSRPDPFCRDGLHLSFGLGRPLVALTWLRTILKLSTP